MNKTLIALLAAASVFVAGSVMAADAMPNHEMAQDAHKSEMTKPAPKHHKHHKHHRHHKMHPMHKNAEMK